MIMAEIAPPDLTLPLINEPAQAYPPAPTTTLGPLQHLIGTWTNQCIHGGVQGGPHNPFSYNLMVLPQTDADSPFGYVLKNFSYYEEITFSAIHGTAPNRGGLGTQVANTLFYEQRIYLAEGPAQDSLIHAENGSWLFLSDAKQLLGPYGDGYGPSVGTMTIPNSAPPSQPFNLVKQMSVPHGNSILASGTFQQQIGSPIISAPPKVLPDGISTDAYYTQGVGNTSVRYTLNPNGPLMAALEVRAATQFIQFDVSSKNSGQPVTNIGFEQQHSEVTDYAATYWLEAFDGSQDFTQLQYSQTITLLIPVTPFGVFGGVSHISFPHITTNTLTKKGS
jgi:hypothetical protein